MPQVLFPKSEFSPQRNSAPDLLILEKSFVERGFAAPVDRDTLTLRIFDFGGKNQILADITQFTTPRIEVKVSGCGTYYFARISTEDFQNQPIEAHWFATRNGKRLCPYPDINIVSTQSTSETFLLHTEVKDWILRKLGFPKVSIELIEGHLCDAIEDALNEYNEYIPLWKYGKIDLVSGRKEYTIPEWGRGIFDVQFRRKEGNPIVSDPLFGRDYPRYTNLDFDHYVLATSFYETLLRTTGQDPIWRWEPQFPDKLYLDTGDNLRSFYLVSYIYAVDHALEDITPAHHERFKRMALARVKIVLGEVREKFGDAIITPGGQVSLNGAKLKNEGTEELRELREELKSLSIPMWPIIAG